MSMDWEGRFAADKNYTWEEHRSTDKAVLCAAQALVEFQSSLTPEAVQADLDRLIVLTDRFCLLCSSVEEIVSTFRSCWVERFGNHLSESALRSCKGRVEDSLLRHLTSMVRHGVGSPRLPGVEQPDGRVLAPKSVSTKGLEVEMMRRLLKDLIPGRTLVMTHSVAARFKIRSSATLLIPPKGILGEARLVYNYKFPNLEMDAFQMAPCYLPSVRLMVRRILFEVWRNPGIPVGLLKRDIAGAFKLVWLRPDVCGDLAVDLDVSFDGVQISQVVGLPLVLTFGWSPSPGVFGSFGAGIDEHHAHGCPAKGASDGSFSFKSYTYVDDGTIVVSQLGNRPAIAAAAYELSCRTILGPDSVNNKKLELEGAWSQEVKAWGVHYNCLSVEHLLMMVLEGGSPMDAGQVTVPDHQVEKIKAMLELECLDTGNEVIPLGVVQSLQGMVVYVASIIPDVSIEIPILAAIAVGDVSGDNSWVSPRGSDEEQFSKWCEFWEFIEYYRDLFLSLDRVRSEWNNAFASYLTYGELVSIFPSMRSKALWISTDADPFGGGAVDWTKKTFSGLELAPIMDSMATDGVFKDADFMIAIKELFMIVVMVANNRTQWSGRVLLIACDNQVVVAWLNKRSGRPPLAQRLLRVFFRVLHEVKAWFYVGYIRSECNKTPDLISRVFDASSKISGQNWLAYMEDEFPDFTFSDLNDGVQYVLSSVKRMVRPNSCEVNCDRLWLSVGMGLVIYDEIGFITPVWVAKKFGLSPIIVVTEGRSPDRVLKAWGDSVKVITTLRGFSWPKKCLGIGGRSFLRSNVSDCSEGKLGITSFQYDAKGPDGTSKVWPAWKFGSAIDVFYELHGVECRPGVLKKIPRVASSLKYGVDVDPSCYDLSGGKMSKLSCPDADVFSGVHSFQRGSLSWHLRESSGAYTVGANVSYIDGKSSTKGAVVGHESETGNCIVFSSFDTHSIPRSSISEGFPPRVPVCLVSGLLRKHGFAAAGQWVLDPSCNKARRLCFGELTKALGVPRVWPSEEQSAEDELFLLRELPEKLVSMGISCFLGLNHSPEKRDEKSPPVKHASTGVKEPNDVESDCDTLATCSDDEFEVMSCSCCGFPVGRSQLDGTNRDDILAKGRGVSLSVTEEQYTSLWGTHEHLVDPIGRSDGLVDMAVDYVRVCHVRARNDCEICAVCFAGLLAEGKYWCPSCGKPVALFKLELVWDAMVRWSPLGPDIDMQNRVIGIGIEPFESHAPTVFTGWIQMRDSSGQVMSVVEWDPVPRHEIPRLRTRDRAHRHSNEVIRGYDSPKSWRCLVPAGSPVWTAAVRLPGPACADRVLVGLSDGSSYYEHNYLVTPFIRNLLGMEWTRFYFQRKKMSTCSFGN